MDKDLEARLFECYPGLFKRERFGDSAYPQLGCGGGWFDLIERLCGVLQYETDHNGAGQLTVRQVKEKMGELRFYISGDETAHQRGAIEMARAMSHVNCEECGNKGSMVVDREIFMVRCKEHTPARAITNREWALRDLKTWGRTRTNVEIIWEGQAIPVWDIDGEEAVFYPELPARLAHAFGAYIERRRLDRDSPCMWAARAEHLRDFIAEMSGHSIKSD